jgi:hypothetical protein
MQVPPGYEKGVKRQRASRNHCTVWSVHLKQAGRKSYGTVSCTERERQLTHTREVGRRGGKMIPTNCLKGPGYRVGERRGSRR